MAIKRYQPLIIKYVLRTIAIIALALPAIAATEGSNINSGDDGLIEVHYNPNYLAPYKERRPKWAGLFGISLDQMTPKNYRSRIDNISYDTMFGADSSANMVELSGGVKYNFFLGSISSEAFYSMGQVSGTVNDNTLLINGETRTLELKKYGLKFSYIMDNLFNEPYVAPYVSGKFFGFDYLETRPGEEVSGQTAFSTGYTLGALFSLNWLDPESAFIAAKNSGLQNTYVDVFISQLNTSDSEEDPQLETDFNYGVGLRVEF